MTSPTTAAGNAGRPDDAAHDTFEASVEHLADQAVTARSVALSTLTHHVYCAAEVIHARVTERGGSSEERDAEVAGMIEAIRAEVHAHLDRLAAKKPGS
ncbi:hypothetical protein [Actinoallomurus sp. CA-142502]|uniref:hypothetical protein n=1 Tax=Actinoallomurus sp. CA-142502 TaxID=3239885 RepID=UPI003D8D15B1